MIYNKCISCSSKIEVNRHGLCINCLLKLISRLDSFRYNYNNINYKKELISYLSFYFKISCPKTLEELDMLIVANEL